MAVGQTEIDRDTGRRKDGRTDRQTGWGPEKKADRQQRNRQAARYSEGRAAQRLRQPAPTGQGPRRAARPLSLGGHSAWAELVSETPAHPYPARWTRPSGEEW